MTRPIFKILIVIILLSGFFFYGLYKSKDFLTGPKIIIENPINGQTISNSYLEITGTAKNISLLYLNGRKIFTDKNGLFTENLLMARGYNIIEASAVDKFGRKTTTRREIVLK